APFCLSLSGATRDLHSFPTRRSSDLSGDSAVQLAGDRGAIGHFLRARNADARSRSALEETLHPGKDFAGRARRMYDSAKLAAVPHAMSKPASELFHFAYTIG